ncbi:MAG: hypothetical protein JWQ38_1855 [Flavipsychrobacter sp.]|nr:hypothetical protein [Flavipsychrobacter sp.]
MNKNYIPRLGLMLLVLIATVSCHNRHNTEPPIPTSGILRQSCSESLGFSGKWQLISIKDSGRNTKPKLIDTLIVEDCSSIERHSGGRLVSKDEFKLYKMTNYCADYQLVYKNDSIGCINIVRDTLIFSECSDFETTRYFYKRILG